MRILAGRSIAVRLAVSSVFWSSFVLVVAGLVLGTLYRRSTERAFDERLLVYANDLAADLAPSPDRETRELGTPGDPRFEIPLSGWYWQAGRLDAAARDLKASRSLVAHLLPVIGGEPDRAFGDIRKGDAPGPEGRILRVLERDIDLGEDGRFVVRVAGPTDEITSAVRQFVLALVSTFLLLGIGLGVSTLLQIRFGLRPLSDLRHAVSAVRQGSADRITGDYPGDLAPLATELNLLLDSNRDILERARTQVGNLAHALKTPLSVIVNEADGQPGETSARVREQADLMRDQVDYYLKRARSAALAGTLGAGAEIEPVIDGLIRTFRKIYRDRPLEIASHGGAARRFRGERQDFEEMVGNLIDNACKWARGRVAVNVSDGARDGRPHLLVTIEDDGPGMPESRRREALERGRRLDETKPGSGLGLSIVADLARQYGGELRLSASTSGGVRAELEVPSDGGA